MQTITVPQRLITQCPIASLKPTHYLGRLAQPCRCYELERTLSEQIRPQHGAIDSIGLRPRFVAALARENIIFTDSLSVLSWQTLSKVRSMNRTGLTALIYLCARRGITVGGVMSLTPEEPPRTQWQAIWEDIARSQEE